MTCVEMVYYWYLATLFANFLFRKSFLLEPINRELGGTTVFTNDTSFSQILNAEAEKCKSLDLIGFGHLGIAFRNSFGMIITNCVEIFGFDGVVVKCDWIFFTTVYFYH